MQGLYFIWEHVQKTCILSNVFRYAFQTIQNGLKNKFLIKKFWTFFFNKIHIFPYQNIKFRTGDLPPPPTFTDMSQTNRFFYAIPKLSVKTWTFFPLFLLKFPFFFSLLPKYFFLPFQAFLVSKTYMLINVKKNCIKSLCPLTLGVEGGGSKP